MSSKFIDGPIFKYSILVPNYLSLSKQQSILCSGNILTECASHQFIASLLQMHHFLPCFRILEMDPINVSSLPTQIMSEFVRRGCWRDSRRGRGFSPGCRVLLSDCPDVCCTQQHVGQQMALTPSRFQWHAEGSFPENRASTLVVASCHLWCLPKPLHHHMDHSYARPSQAWISAPG